MIGWVKLANRFQALAFRLFTHAHCNEVASTRIENHKYVARHDIEVDVCY
jgi:hypothetical protein